MSAERVGSEDESSRLIVVLGGVLALSTAALVWLAGNGMVGDSDPPTELIETRAKLQAMLTAIVRP